MRVVKLRRAGILLRTLLIATLGFARSPCLRGVSFFWKLLLTLLKKSYIWIHNRPVLPSQLCLSHLSTEIEGGRAETRRGQEFCAAKDSSQISLKVCFEL